MNQSNYKLWLSNLGSAWSERDPETAASLFSKNCKYFESVFEPPCASWDAILKLWQAVPNNQKNVTFKLEIIGFSDGFCITNWKVSRSLIPSNEKQLIDGIFYFSLNQSGLCDYFKQWRSVKRI